jgi:hypothetical protein
MNEDTLAWAQEEFGGAKLGDARQVKSIIGIAAGLAAHPERSFSSAAGHAGRQAAHRIFEHEKTTVAGLAAGHVQQTTQRCAEYPLVLIAQDTTMFVYKQNQIQGLAPLNRRQKTVGLVGHAALAQTPAGTPLGLLHLEIWGLDEEAPVRLPDDKLPEEERESQKWLRGLESTAKALPSGTHGVLIQDREGDIFRLLCEKRPANVDLLLRAAQDRVVHFEPVTAEGKVEPTVRGYLKQEARKAPVVGTLRVSVPRRSARHHEVAVPEREAVLTLRVREVRVQPPAEQKAVRTEQHVWLICAREEAPPAGAEPVEWILVTTLPVSNAAAAAEIVGYYARRWLIERLHYTLKSGLRAEHLQIDDAVSLAHALTLYYVVAWRLMHLTFLGRHEPEAPASQVLSPDELAVLAAAERKTIVTVREAVLAIARQGGYLPYQKTPPGLKVLWLGLQQVQAMAAGFRLAQQALGNPPSYEAR